MCVNFTREYFGSNVMKRNAARTCVSIQMMTAIEMPDSKYAYCHHPALHAK